MNSATMSCFFRLRRRTVGVSHPLISAHVSPSVAHLSHGLFWLGRRFTLFCCRVVVMSTRHRSSPTRFTVPRGTQVSAATVHSGGAERKRRNPRNPGQVIRMSTYVEWDCSLTLSCILSLLRRDLSGYRLPLSATGYRLRWNRLSAPKEPKERCNYELLL